MSDLNEVRRLIESEQLEEARDVLVDVLYQDYDNAEAWLLLIHCPQDHEEYARAIREVLRIDPENVEARRLAVELARDTSRQASATPKRQQQHRRKRTFQRTVRTFSNLIIVLIVLGVGAVIAFVLTATQDDDEANTEMVVPTVDPVVACTNEIHSTLNRLQARCSFLERDQVCLGNPSVEFTGTNGELRLQFPGDRTTTQQITALGTERFDNLNWGLVVISARSSFSDESDNSILMVVTSGVRVQNIDDRMERFSFGSNPVASSCPAVPPSGILVSVPIGETADFEVNGAIIALQGTAFLQVDAAAGLRVTALAGSIHVSHDNFERILEAGEWFSWSVDPTLIVRDEPGDIMTTPDQLRGDISLLVDLGLALELPVNQWHVPGMDTVIVLPESSPSPEPDMSDDEPFATEEINESNTSTPSQVATRTPTPIPPDFLTPSGTDDEIIETEEAPEPTARTIATRATIPTTSPLEGPSTSAPSPSPTEFAPPQATVVAEAPKPLPEIAEQGSTWRCSVILGEITFRYLITLEPTETTSLLASGQLPNFGNTIVALDGEWIIDPTQLGEAWGDIPGMDTTTARAWLFLEETEILSDSGDNNYGIGGRLRLALTENDAMSGAIFDDEQLLGFINRCELQ